MHTPLQMPGDLGPTLLKLILWCALMILVSVTEVFKKITAWTVCLEQTCSAGLCTTMGRVSLMATTQITLSPLYIATWNVSEEARHNAEDWKLPTSDQPRLFPTWPSSHSLEKAFQVKELVQEKNLCGFLWIQAQDLVLPTSAHHKHLIPPDFVFSEFTSTQVCDCSSNHYDRSRHVKNQYISVSLESNLCQADHQIEWIGSLTRQILVFTYNKKLC